jgi:hypothetical protein
MRIVVSWDGSGHAIGVLRSLVTLIREQSVEHIEVVVSVWPARDIARWTDIAERQFVADDLHRAAAEEADIEVARLEEVLRPIAQSIVSTKPVGAYLDVLFAAVERTKADLLLVVAGAHDPSHVIESTLPEVIARSKVPTCILRPPASN